MKSRKKTWILGKSEKIWNQEKRHEFWVSLKKDEIKNNYIGILGKSGKDEIKKNDIGILG